MSVGGTRCARWPDHRPVRASPRNERTGMLAPSRASRLGTRCARSVCIGGTASIVLHAHLAVDRGQRLDETGGTASIVLHAHLAVDRGQRLDETGGAAGAATSASAGP